MYVCKEKTLCHDRCLYLTKQPKEELTTCQEAQRLFCTDFIAVTEQIWDADTGSQSEVEEALGSQPRAAVWFLFFPFGGICWEGGAALWRFKLLSVTVTPCHLDSNYTCQLSLSLICLFLRAFKPSHTRLPLCSTRLCAHSFPFFIRL